MKSPDAHGRTIIGVLFIATSIGLLLALLIQHSGLLRPLERNLAWRVAAGSPAPRDSGLVRIVINDLSDQSWPLPRLDYAILLHALMPYEPELLALDWPLDLSETHGDIYNGQLLRQMKAYRGVVATARIWRDDLPDNSPPQDTLAVKGSLDHIPRLSGVRWPDPSLWPALRASPLSAGEHDRLPLIFRQGDAVVPAFPLAVYGRWLGAYWPHCTVQPGREIVLRDYYRQRLARIPIDLTGALHLLPEHRLPPAQEVEFYTAILAAEQMRQNQTPLFDLNRLRHNLVLATIEHPEAVAPVGEEFVGARLSRALRQMISRVYVQPAPVAVGIALIAISTLLMAWAGTLPLLRHAVVSWLAGAGFLVFDGWFFLRFFDLEIPWLAALIGGTAAWAAAVTLSSLWRTPPAQPSAHSQQKLPQGTARTSAPPSSIISP